MGQCSYGEFSLEGGQVQPSPTLTPSEACWQKLDGTLHDEAAVRRGGCVSKPLID